MKRIVLLFLSLIFVVACNSNRPPEGVLDEQKMVNVLTDLTAIDGFMSTLMYTDSMRIEGKSYYATVYKKHNINKAIFDKSLKYYSTQPVLLDSMYNKVTRNLEAKEKRLLKIQELEEAKKRKKLIK